MKTLPTFILLAMLLLSAGCGMSPTKVRERVIEHKRQGGYYTLLCQVLEPTHLAGRYDVVATLRSDLITNIDGAEFEVYLNFTMVGTLTQNKPDDYFISAPSPGSGDYLDSASE